jgi:hypothetical protein
LMTRIIFGDECRSLSFMDLRIMSMKNSIDTIGNWTRDLPACSAVPQPTAPPRAPCTPVPIV